MSKWYSRITRDPDDYSPVLSAIEWFEQQYEEAQKDLVAIGKRIETVALELPSQVDYRFGQLQELEAIIRYFEIKEDKMIADHRRRYIEHYNRSLSDRMAEKYSEGEEDVVTIRQLRNHVALIRNKYLGLLKGMEYLHFQIGNIIKLRLAGFDDVVF